jgi:hypothetical protein
MKRIVILLLTLCTGACASFTQQGGLDTRADIYFAGQESCSRFISDLADPVIPALARIPTINGMRLWIAGNPQYAFSRIALEVQAGTRKDGVIHPSKDHDQLIVTKEFYRKLQTLPEFRQSKCSVDVHEVMIDRLYLGLGGDESLVARDLAKKGISESSDKRWALLIALMAGKLPAGW